MTRNNKCVVVEDEDTVALNEQTVVKDRIEKMNKEVRQRREKQITVEEKEKEEKEQFEKNKNEEKSRSEKEREKRKEKALDEGTKVPYPVVPSKKDKGHHLARFLDIFKKLEITMPFGEALQQMPLYSKFLKDMLTRKNKYIHQENIVVEGNCSAMIQKILPPKHNPILLHFT